MSASGNKIFPVTFVRLEHGAYRDGIKFGNGKEISLQLLGSGVGVTLATTGEKQSRPSARADRLITGDRVLPASIVRALGDEQIVLETVE